MPDDSKKWSKAGDTCPNYGSQDTVSQDYERKLKRRNTLGASAIVNQGFRVTMKCNNCDHEEQVTG
jgi:hypothetical protein